MNKPIAQSTKWRPFRNIRYDWKHNKFLLLLSVPAVVWFLLFSYVPLYGIIVAFQKFSPAKGIFGSDFVAFNNFKFFFNSQDFFKVTFNTLFLNALFIVATMLVSIVIALALSEIRAKYFKKATQSIVILPHFISWTVVALLCEALLTTDKGLINQLLRQVGADPILFYQDNTIWPLLLTALRVWQGAGYGSIVYLATITGIDRSIYEAATIDGASKLQSIRYLTLPLLRPTATMLFLMSVGKIFNGDFGMIYALVGNNTMLYPTTDIIDTYVYRQLVEANNMGMSAAVGVYQSIMGFAMVLGANWVAKKMDPDSALF